MVKPCFRIADNTCRAPVGVLAREATFPVLCLGGFRLAVSHTAPTGDLLTSPVLDGKEQPSQELNQYGVGVDCHSRFFQICILIANGPQVQQSGAWVFHPTYVRLQHPVPEPAA
jgi:hypothetical protein